MPHFCTAPRRGPIRPIFFLIVCLCGATGCGKKAQVAPGFRVALLSPGPVSDGGWNGAAYEGLLEIKKELGAEISQIETTTPSEFEEAFRDYARRGFDLIFGHGFEFQDAAAAVAPDFPRSIFITTSGNTLRPNVAPMVFELEDATFLAGYLAALMSKTGRLGAVGGMKIPPVASTFAAFEAGARLARPNVKFTATYIGNWEDAGAARQAALALIDQGCDFLIHNADAAAAGLFQAATERDVFVFGTNKNQNGIAPDHVLASCVSDIPRAFVEMAKRVRDKRFEPRIYRLGMPDGVVRLVLNDRLQAKIPAAILQKLTTLEAEIQQGTRKVPTLL